MRQLKFRAWDTVDKKWLFGYEYPSLGGFSLVGEVTLMGELNSVALDRWNDVAIMQFTGLTDKNGKEIYEDDIVTPVRGTIQHTVEWQAESASYLAAPIRGPGAKSLVNAGVRFVVVGNIHENPELLK